jgi:hypothetical protein
MSKVLTFVARHDARAFAPLINICGSDDPLTRPEIEFASSLGPTTIAYAAPRQAVATSDYTVENKGTLLLLRSTNAKAYDWLVAHTAPEAHWFGRALVVEHGYIVDFVARLRCDGFSVDETLA